MKTTNKVILFRTVILCNILCILGIINGLNLIHIRDLLKEDTIFNALIFVLSIIVGIGGFVGGIASIGAGIELIVNDVTCQIRSSKFLSWCACHVYRLHYYKEMRKIVDDFSNEYSDEVCIFCNKVNLDATKFERKEKKKVNIDQLTQNAKNAYLNHLTKEEQKDLFIERI